MAQKQTTQDAVSAAMSAIEEALNLSADESPVGEAAPPASAPAPAAAPPAPAPAAAAPVKSSPVAPPALAAAVKAPPAQDPVEPPPSVHRQPSQLGASERALGAGTPPANDDRATIGLIVQALKSRRPSRAPFVAAAVAALVWLALCALYAVLRFPATGWDLAAARDYLLRPETISLALAALGPTILLFGFAALARRMQELRGSASSIAQVALRLAEPETTAGEQLVTLSQAVRREIASMGDGVERALARAAELETMVRSEVSTLERAYSDNERRIRSLIAEMADQREAIVANGGRLRAAVDEAHRGIADDLETLAQRLAEHVSNVGERVAASLGESSEKFADAMEHAGAGTVDRIAAQGAQIQESLTAVGADVATRLAEVSSRGVQEIVARVAGVDERIKDNSAQAVEAIQSHTEALATRLAMASEAAARDFDERSNELVDRVEACGRRLSETVFTRGEGLASRLDEASGRLHETLVVRGQTLEDALAASNERIASALSAKTEDARAVLDAAGATWSEHFEARHAQLRGFIDEAAGALSGQIEESTRRAVEAISDQGAATQDRLREASEASLDQWSEQTAAVGERFAAVAGEAVASIAVSGDSLHDAVASRIASFEETIGARGGALVAALAAQIGTLDEQLNSLAGLVGDGGDSVIERIGAHAARLGESLGAQVEAIDAIMSGRQAELDDRLTDHQARFEQASNARLAEFDNASAAHQTVVELALTAHAGVINDAVRDGLANFETTFAQRGEELISRVNAEAKSLTTQIDDKLSTIEETTAARGRALDERLEQHNQKSAALFESEMQAAERSTSEKLKEIAASLEGLLERIDSGLAARGRALDERLEQHNQKSAALFESEMQAAERSTSEKLKEIAASLEGLLERIDSGLAARGKALNETLAKNTIEIAKSLSEGGREITRGIEGGVDRFRDQIVSPLQALSTQFDGAISAHGAALHESIASAADRIGASFSTQRDAIAATLTAAIENLDAALAGRGDKIAGNFAARIEELRSLMAGPDGTDFITQFGQRGAQISSQITGVSERAAQTFEYQTSNLIALMTRRGEDLIAAINASAADSVHSLGALTGQLSSEVEQSGAALRDAVERNAGASVTALTAAGERMRNELSQVLDRLGQASLALDRVVEGAGDKLDAIQGDLGEKIDEMQRALGAMAAQVSELDQMSSNTQTASGSLVERMAMCSAALAEISRDLAAKQQTIDQALERRYTSLQNLLAAIDAKSQEFDAAASRFTASFEESFNRAQGRAQEISASLALATKGTASTVVSQFEMIRENAGAERERTALALQAAYEQANAQLSEVMNDTADRFRQSVAEVKQMAGEVQRQLDATRQELRRGVFELPEETNEAASAMRRVVSDQIKALRELTAVVTASGADFDVAEPAAATAPARFDAARDGAASRIADASRDDGRALVAAPIAAETARPLAKPARPRAPQPAASAPPTSPSIVERGQSGWLSNLLAAASRDEARSATGLAANDALEGISLDIAKFVDAEAAAEMWDRWRSGDTTAVSRRLYTAQGQQTFDEVRRRFRNDPQFQVSVTRYTQEFERLLAKIGQSDRDGAQSRATLLSDAGKVYTMLAHASGRLG